MNRFLLLLCSGGLAAGLNVGLLSAEQNSAITAAQQIDALIDQKLAEQGQAPNEAIDDATFLRRVYLDLIGRIPTLEEGENFYAGDPADRRSQLIDDLLACDGYVRHCYHFWADLLRINKRLGINETPDDVEYAYRLWIKKALRENLPYDEFVRQLVTAEGHSWDNGAVGYYHRDRGMPLDNMSNTVRVFLGTRLECAQCHDHPFDDWTQMDYYRMAAFSYGMQSKGHSHANREALREHLEQEGVKAYRQATGVEGMPQFSKPNEIQRWIGASKNKNKGDWQNRLREWSLTEAQFVAAAKRGIDALGKHTRKARQVIRAEDSLHVRVRYVTAGEKPRTLHLPHDYQYRDAAPHDEVAARTMFGDSADASIADYAGWMASKSNPTFTRVVANRLWKKVFGAALFEPVDEITGNTTIHHPQLMAYLEQLMGDLDYDMRAYLEVLCKTRAYRRAATVRMPAAGEAYLFPGPVLRRMTAEQIWDSLIGQVLPEVDRYSPNLKRQLRAIRNRERIYDALVDKPPEQYIAGLIGYSEVSSASGAELAQIRKELPLAVAAKDANRVRELQERQKQLMNGLGEGISRLQKNPQAELDDDELLASFGIAEKKIARGSDTTSQEAGSDPEFAELWPLATTLSRPVFPRGPSAMDAGQQGEWRERAQTEYRAFLGLTSKWARASELPSPAPRGHFLRDFGQSDRVMIDNAAMQASVPQALNLLNGPLAEALSNRFSVLGGRVHAAESPEERAELLVEGLLTRKASEQEMQWMLAEIENSGENAALQNIAWALINTRQFLFVR